MDSNVDLKEYEELAANLDREQLTKDEDDAYFLNDEYDAYTIENNNLTKGELPSLESDGVEAAPEQMSYMQDKMAKYMSAIANHQPGKKFTIGDVNYTVQDTPHRGVWIRDELVVVSNPNFKNKSVRNKLQRHPKKYSVVNS